jgi:hypothetical protein
LTSSFGIEGNRPTSRSSFLILLGITRLPAVGYASHTDLRTGSNAGVLNRSCQSQAVAHRSSAQTPRVPAIIASPSLASCVSEPFGLVSSDAHSFARVKRQRRLCIGSAPRGTGE